MARNQPRTPKSSTEKPSKAPPKVIAVVDTGESPAEIAADIMKWSLLRVRAEIKGLIDGSIVPDKHDVASKCAWLAKETSPVARETRLAEKAELESIRKITLTVLLVWARQQTPEVRSRLMRELAAMDSPTRKSVMG